MKNLVMIHRVVTKNDDGVLPVGPAISLFVASVAMQATGKAEA